MFRIPKLAGVSLAVLLTVGLAACGSDDAASDGAADGSAAGQSSPTVAPAATSDGSAATSEGSADAAASDDVSSDAASSDAESPAAGSSEAASSASGSSGDSTAAAGSSADSSAGESSDATGAWEPVTIEHALGSVTISERPERVVTVNWANHEVPLALGIVPVGMARTDWGDDNGNGIHPWVEAKLEELGGEQPVVFDETDGIDFEAVADTDPDVILAGYSGLSQEDYDTLSELAPVVAYPQAPWATPWREMIRINSSALGLADEGDQLIADYEQDIAEAVADHPQLEGTTAMFMTHIDVTDLSKISYYSAKDTRTQFFNDLGMKVPDSLSELSADSDAFNGSISTEQADVFADVDIIVTYGGQELIDALEADPIMSQLPAVKNGAIVNLPGDQPLGTAANPTPLAIPTMVPQYVELLAAAATKAGR